MGRPPRHPRGIDTGSTRERSSVPFAPFPDLSPEGCVFMLRPLFLPALLLPCLACVLLFSPVVGAQPDFEFRLEGPPLNYNVGDGAGSVEWSLTLVEDVAPGSSPLLVQGLTVSGSFDDSQVFLQSFGIGDALISLGGGVGPDLWTPFVVDGGFTIGIVFSIFDASALPFDVEGEVAEFVFATAPGVFAGDSIGTTLPITNDSPPGSPVDTADTVVADTIQFPANFTIAPLEIRPLELLRGDANLDGAVVVIADAIQILGGLFDPEVTLLCLDAADVNDDGAVDLADPISLLNFGFGGNGPPPAAPFPDCGPDPTDDALDCQVSGC